MGRMGLLLSSLRWVIGPAALAAALAWRFAPDPILAGPAAFAALIVSAAWYGLTQRRRIEAFAPAYAAERGLVIERDVDPVEAGIQLPIVERGRSRALPLVMRGSIHGQHVTIARFHAHTPGSGSDDTGSSHDCWLVHQQLPQAASARVRALSIQRSSRMLRFVETFSEGSPWPVIARIGDPALDEAWAVRIAEDQDRAFVAALLAQVELRELLARTRRPFVVQARGGQLAVAIERLQVDGSLLDELSAFAAAMRAALLRAAGDSARWPAAAASPAGGFEPVQRRTPLAAIGPFFLLFVLFDVLLVAGVVAWFVLLR